MIIYVVHCTHFWSMCRLLIFCSLSLAFFEKKCFFLLGFFFIFILRQIYFRVHMHMHMENLCCLCVFNFKLKTKRQAMLPCICVCLEFLLCMFCDVMCLYPGRIFTFNLPLKFSIAHFLL